MRAKKTNPRSDGDFIMIYTVSQGRQQKKNLQI